MEQIKTVFKNKKIKWTVCILGGVFIALLIFQTGMFVGFSKASFSYRTGEQYFRQMNGDFGGPMGIQRGDFSNSHGTIVKIVSIKLPLIVVSDKDGTEKSVLISTSTSIKQFRNDIASGDLKVNDFIAVIGDPNNKSQVEAKLIRIMPDPGSMPFGTSTQR